MQPYEVIKAKSPLEAIEQSKFKLGALVKVVTIEAVSNSDGTFSIFPIVSADLPFDVEQTTNGS